MKRLRSHERQAWHGLLLQWSTRGRRTIDADLFWLLLQARWEDIGYARHP